ncbi:MAG: hypothetical protein JNK16_15385 [Phycisphaerales bacterium]|nr:hypothetical protein [Phycisphaerales bacterium]
MNCARGFALRDVVFGTFGAALLGAIAVPALSQVRMDTSRQVCIGNYRFIAQASASYSNDFAGQMSALNWERGMQFQGIGGTGYFDTNMFAQAFQANTIMRRLSPLLVNEISVPQGWLANAFYSHLPLADYIGLPLPANYLVCPDDLPRQRFLDGDLRALQSGGSEFTSYRRAVTSSYTIDIYRWSPSRQLFALENGRARKSTMTWIGNSLVYFDPGDINAGIWDSFRPRLESDVRFPANKVAMSDDYARHNGKPRYYAYQTAAQDMLFYDGSVRYFRTDATNPGWNPSSSQNRGNMKSRYSFTKQPDIWGGLDNNASQASFTAGWYRYTRGGLQGWDVPRMNSMVGKLPNATIVESEVDTSAATGTW